MFEDDKSVLCRLCLQRSDCLIDIFHPKGTNGFLVWKIIKEFVELEVSRDDGLPPTICRNCLNKLTDFKYFKRMCINSRIEFLKIQLTQGLIAAVKIGGRDLDGPVEIDVSASDGDYSEDEREELEEDIESVATEKIEGRDLDEPEMFDVSSSDGDYSEDEREELEKGIDSKVLNVSSVDADEVPAVDGEKGDRRTLEVLDTLKRMTRSATRPSMGVVMGRQRIGHAERNEEKEVGSPDVKKSGKKQQSVALGATATDEEHQKRLERNREYSRKYYSSLSEEKKRVIVGRKVECKKRRMASMSEEEKRKMYRQNYECRRRRQAMMSVEEKEEYLRKCRERSSRIRRSMSDEKRAALRQQKRNYCLKKKAALEM